MAVVRSIVAPLALSAVFAANAGAQAPAPAAPAADTKVVQTEVIHAVVLPMKGSYMQHPEAFQRLGAFLTGKGIKPGGDAFGRYFSDPSVGEANFVWEIGFPVPADFKVEAPFEIKDIPAGLAAVHVHRGPMEELGNAWGTLFQWAMTNGYQPLGPAFQIFKDQGAVVEMRLPVQKN